MRHSKTPRTSLAAILPPRPTGSTGLDKLPDRMREAVADAYEDPNLLSIRPEVALLVARQGELAARIDTGESGAAWERLQKISDEIEKNNSALAVARASGDDSAAADIQAEQSALLKEIFSIIRKKNSSEAAAVELMEFSQQLTTIKKAEVNRLALLHEMMTVDESVRLANVLTAIVLANVKDKEVMHKIAYEFRAATAEIGHRRSFDPIAPSHAPEILPPAGSQNPAVVD